MKTTNFLKDSKGNDSSNRFAFMLILINAFVIVDYLVFTKAPIIEIVAIWTALMSTAITIKTIGKSQENSELKIEKDG